jgi:hypothetical protein
MNSINIVDNVVVENRQCILQNHQAQSQEVYENLLRNICRVFCKSGLSDGNRSSRPQLEEHYT